MIKELEGRLTCEVQVSWIDSDSVNRNLEIKAVTSHELMIIELSDGESYRSDDDSIPELIGPAWVAMLFLIYSGNSKDGRSYFMAKSTHFLHPATPQHSWP